MRKRLQAILSLLCHFYGQLEERARISIWKPTQDEKISKGKEEE